MKQALANQKKARMHLRMNGVVQGVGFRPAIYRLAHSMGIAGFTANSGQGVEIEAEAEPELLEIFVQRLVDEKPPHCMLENIEQNWMACKGGQGFRILASDSRGAASTLILPDLAPCTECLQEMNDRSNRRYRYPFLNCTLCGPRFSILYRLPYDRCNTSMADFAMCPACLAEYENPLNRRFHAQPTACPVCGPQLSLLNRQGLVLCTGEDALQRARERLLAGDIAAVQGVGGFHLMADAAQPKAVQQLRARKHREAKPFAMLCANVQQAEQLCMITDLEKRALESVERPIVLMQRRTAGMIAPETAPGTSRLGIMLPASPLQALLMEPPLGPMIATSGNLSEEPICTGVQEALQRLAGIADCFLVYNRAIVRPIDDSVVQTVLGGVAVLRRSRGYAPLPVLLPAEVPALFAAGAHQKNTFCLAFGRHAFLSQHMGDLETAASGSNYRREAVELQHLLGIRPQMARCDMHPDYFSTRHAEQCGLPLKKVQHHMAHAYACLAENQVEENALCIAWDGTGLGEDGSIWGGEFFTGSLYAPLHRIATLRPFVLPGGDAAARSPRRSALGLLYACKGEEAFEQSWLPPFAGLTEKEIGMLRAMLQRGINCPVTHSAGRLFDAAYALAGGRQEAEYEVQAALEWQALAESSSDSAAYTMHLEQKEILELNWEPLVQELLADVKAEAAMECMARRFHNGLAQGIVQVALHANRRRVGLCGGCFQNVYLLEKTVALLQQAGFEPFWSVNTPAGDGGIALGQAVTALWKGEEHVPGSTWEN